MDKQTIINILFLLIIFAMFFVINNQVFKKEGFEADSVATLASMYTTSEGHLKITNLTVGQNIEANGKITAGDWSDIIPRGVVVSYTGTTAPNGWALCNGENDTPDLRSRFILGASPLRMDDLSIRQINQTGGAEKVQLEIAHLPSHDHTIQDYTRRSSALVHFAYDKNSKSNFFRANEGNYATGKVGGNTPHENMPPFYVLTFIMKL